jgi:hypothetical protein
VVVLARADFLRRCAVVRVIDGPTLQVTPIQVNVARPDRAVCWRDPKRLEVNANPQTRFVLQGKLKLAP